MKRGRTSRVSGPSFMDLPKDLLQNILFRIPIKSILLCKSVCKTYYDRISDPEFSKLYFQETCYRFYPLIHAKKFYLLKPDKDDFEPNNVDFVFDSKFDLSSFIHDLLIESSERSRESRRRRVRRRGVRSQVLTVSYSINIANSCNGLLCCFYQGPKSRATICNPITGEFVEIPECTNPDLCEGFVIYGFGFSHVDNKYKVVGTVSHSGTARVHIVGTESWRDISSKPDYPISNCQPTFFKGFLYWTTSQESLSLMFFDIENECFGLDSGPVEEPYIYVLVNVGILRGELCISSVTKSKTIHIWAKQDSAGVEITQWSKVYSIDLSGMPIEGSLEPIEFLSDGSLLMFYYHVNAFIHVDPEKRRFRFFKIKGKKMRVQKIFAHVPSLVSLKHSLGEHNVKVLNFHHQRCEVLKLK